MQKLLFVFILSRCSKSIWAQAAKTDLYDMVKKLLYDSTGFENVGDGAVGKPKKYPVSWKSDRIEMSPDTSINFFRQGSADISISGRSFSGGAQPVQWRILLKGARMGYASFNIISTPAKALEQLHSLDSLFEKKAYSARLTGIAMPAALPVLIIMNQKFRAKMWLISS